ncbi:MAG: hypothetical protein Q9167_002080 [Letrouitia subvulpina]
MSLSPTTAFDRSVSESLPTTRESSPSPSISPTPAVSACPPLDRSCSATSSIAESTVSGNSVGSRSSSASTTLRQRGYVRPQGVSFADSAGKRDSVLSLGSIAHLQYYFARTGLLDGKGGQLATDSKLKRRASSNQNAQLPKIRSTSGGSATDEDEVTSAAGEDDTSLEWDGHTVLPPPTVSTYRHKIQHLPPPPDSSKLRRDLKKALRDAAEALQGVQAQLNEGLNRPKRNETNQAAGIDRSGRDISQFGRTKTSGWYEIQGLHILDTVTLAIRAAKLYYTAHESPQRLYSIKSERHIREELLGVLDVLKRMASRNFAGGLKEEEFMTIQNWLRGIERFIAEEHSLEKEEYNDLQKWIWLEGSWDGREREREWLFLKSFMSEQELPEWVPLEHAESPPTPFLQAMQNGLTLIKLHNAMLTKSKRSFGEIKNFHSDTSKPYRCAENLRYWIKAVEIRWESKLKVDVTGVVHSKDSAWPDFDAAIAQWCKAAREELTQEWKETAKLKRSSTMYPISLGSGRYSQE